MENIKMIETLDDLKSLNETEIKEIVAKWETIGFTEGLNEPKLTNVSIALEAVILLFIYVQPDEYKNEVKTIAFPIARRIVQAIEQVIPTNIIVDNMVNMLKTLNEEIKNTLTNDFIEECNNLNIDYEAEFSAKFSDNYKLEL